jgi:hypothetical protein
MYLKVNCWGKRGKEREATGLGGGRTGKGQADRFKEGIEKGKEVSQTQTKVSFFSLTQEPGCCRAGLKRLRQRNMANRCAISVR